MFSKFPLSLFLLRSVLALSLIFHAPVYAQEYGGNSDRSGGQGGDGANSVGLSNATTKSVVRILKRGIRQCKDLEKIYRYDCYRIVYRRAADKMGSNPSYAEARAALIGVEQTLTQIVAQNTDPNPPRATSKTRQFTAIRPDAVPASTAKFRASLEEAETQLLRAPDQSQLHFASIAEAVNSNKVLLRS